MKIDRQFTSVSDLRRWLKSRSDACGSPEAFDSWLQSYFDEGNTVTVRGEEYDYWSCWEML